MQSYSKIFYSSTRMAGLGQMILVSCFMETDAGRLVVGSAQGNVIFFGGICLSCRDGKKIAHPK